MNAYLVTALVGGKQSDGRLPQEDTYMSNYLVRIKPGCYYGVQRQHGPGAEIVVTEAEKEALQALEEATRGS